MQGKGFNVFKEVEYKKLAKNVVMTQNAHSLITLLQKTGQALPGSFLMVHLSCLFLLPPEVSVSSCITILCLVNQSSIPIGLRAVKPMYPAVAWQTRGLEKLVQLKEVEGDGAEACGAEKRMGCSGAMYVYPQWTAVGLITYCLIKNLGGLAGQMFVAISPHCVTPNVKSRWMPA